MLKHVISNKAPTNSALTYFLLAFIAMTGLSYINFLPGVVNALAGGIGLSNVEAGEITALNGYGGLVGSIVAIFLVRRIHWQPAMFTFLALLALIDIGTGWIDDYSVMLVWRFVAGILGGLSVGIAFSVLARLDSPDRAFGTLLFVQFSIGSLVIYLLPGLEALISSHAVFYVMASFSLLSLFFMMFLPALTLESKSIKQSTALPGVVGNTLLLLLAITCYQIAASAIWTYIGLIGLGANIDTESVSMYIAATGLLGLLGSMLPVINGNRFGRLYWVIAGVLLSVISALMLSFSPLTPLIYILSMALLFFSWPAVQSYLLAVTAELDDSGRLSTIAAVVSSVGLASGSLLGSSLLGDGEFSMMLYICAIIFLLSLVLLFKPVLAKEKEKNTALSPQYQS